MVKKKNTVLFFSFVYHHYCNMNIIVVLSGESYRAKFSSVLVFIRCARSRTVVPSSPFGVRGSENILPFFVSGPCISFRALLVVVVVSYEYSSACLSPASYVRKYRYAVPRLQRWSCSLCRSHATLVRVLAGEGDITTVTAAAVAHDVVQRWRTCNSNWRASLVPQEGCWLCVAL